MKLEIRSLQQRFSLFMLLPVAMLLVAMGFGVFIMARNHLRTQWKESAILKLERAARDVDLRLSAPKDWMRLYHKTAVAPAADQTREWVVRQLEDLEGVERVTLTSVGTDHQGRSQAAPCPLPPAPGACLTWRRGAENPWMSQWKGMMEFERAEIAGVTLPRYDELIEHETVSLASDLLGKDGKVVGRLEVVVRFQYLVEGILSSGWSQSEKAFLIGDGSRILACGISEKAAEQGCYDEAIGEAVKAMQRESSGAIIDPGHSKGEVVGFYKLKEAPWSIVLVARSEEILAPILHFRLVYLVMVAGFVVFILLLIRFVAGRTVSRIQEVSQAARRVAEGSFDTLPPARSRDEVGRLIESFNEMVSQLDERIRLKEAMDLAMKVQQSLLPTRAPDVAGLDIAGASIYCDETGGDYYDFIRFPEWDSRRIGIAIGDVAGHGISAALFMTTVRAFLRSRIMQPGSLAAVMGDVNRLLTLDTSGSGDFMSLFLLVVETDTSTLRWVRAGHPPAIIYDREADRFEELRGGGMVLGFDEEGSFKEYEYAGWNGSKVLFLGTDGIWETENPEGEPFGMERLHAVIREYGDRPAQEVIDAVLQSVKSFRREKPQEDDVTMVIIKAGQ